MKPTIRLAPFAVALCAAFNAYADGVRIAVEVPDLVTLLLLMVAKAPDFGTLLLIVGGFSGLVGIGLLRSAVQR